MRTLMIAPQPFFQPRGTPFSVLHRLRALSKLGYEIDLLTYHLGEDVQIDGVTIHRIPKVPFIKKIDIGPSKAKIILDLFIFFKAKKILSARRFDLIHSHEEAGFFASYLAKKYRTLHLYDMHSSLPQQLSNFKFTNSKWITGVFEKLEAATINKAQAVITICPELYHYINQRFPDKFNMLIENVADNSLVFDTAPTVANLREKIKTNGEVIILYTGTFEPYQGIDLLIDSGARIVEKEKNVRFVLVGGKPEQVQSYQKQVKDLNLADHFVFTGSVLPGEIPAYIDASDVLVSPRIKGNNTPLKIYSYLRSGKPIVATRHITHTQVLNDESAVLTDCTPEAFSEGVLTILRDKLLAARVVEQAKKMAQEKYSYEGYLEKTRKVYTYLENQLGQKKRAN
ncbi:MAG: glycosyltransferase family 4 protein [bacterium]